MITAAYIPARLGSVRLPGKNLRLLSGRPLVSHVLRAAREVSAINHLYLNTESEAIAAVGRDEGIDIYMREKSLASSDAKTDEILYDFAKNVSCDKIVVINPTAPFLASSTIERFILSHLDLDTTFFTTSLMKRHLVFRDSSVNFDVNGPSPKTQDLEPFDIINFIMFSIGRSKVLREFERNGYCLYTGGLQFYRMSGLECHDIDDEAEFRLAEAMAAMRQSAGKSK